MQYPIAWDLNPWKMTMCKISTVVQHLVSRWKTWKNEEGKQLESIGGVPAKASLMFLSIISAENNKQVGISVYASVLHTLCVFSLGFI